MFVTVNCLVLLPKQVSATKMFKLFSSVINPFRFSEQNVCTSVNNPRPSICLLYELSVITPWNVTAPLESAQQTQCLKLRALFPRRAAICYDFSIVITALIPNCLSAKISEVLHNYRPSLGGHIDQYLPVISESDVSRLSDDSWAIKDPSLIALSSSHSVSVMSQTGAWLTTVRVLCASLQVDDYR